MSHQGRNTRTRWYGKPIIIVFTRQQRAAIKNCLFIQARLFSIRWHTSDESPCVHVRPRACTCTARTTRRDFSAYQTVVSNFPPVRRFPACAGPAEKKLPVTSAIAEEGLKSGATAASRALDRSRESERVASDPSGKSMTNAEGGKGFKTRATSRVRREKYYEKKPYPFYTFSSPTFTRNVPINLHMNASVKRSPSIHLIRFCTIFHAFVNYLRLARKSKFHTYYV